MEQLQRFQDCEMTTKSTAADIGGGAYE